MAVKKSHEWFIGRVAIANPSLRILGTYNGVESNVTTECDICSHVWDAYAGALLQGSGCPSCYSNKRKLSEESFLEKLSVTKVNVSLISPYKYRSASLVVKCNVCGYEWTTTGSTLLKAEANGCLKCSGNMPKTPADFLKDLSAVTRTIEVLTDYIDAKTKLNVRCKVCNHTWSAKPPNLITGYGCPSCAGNMPKTHEVFIQELYEISPSIKVLSKYKRALEKVDVECTLDGNKWSATPDNLLHGKGCPLCAGYGFRVNLAATFYTYRFSNYYGFGVTNYFEERNKKHQKTFNKLGIQAELMKTYEGSGQYMLDMETHLKRTLPIYNTGIDGFKTEAVLKEDGILLFREIEKYMIDNPPKL